MNATTRPLTHTLARREMLRRFGRAGTRIRCDEGALWITRDGDLNDTVLQKGESYLLDDDAMLLVYAFEPSSLRFCGEVTESEPHVPAVLANAWRALRAGVHA